jgi:hypothetical protein
MRKLCWLLLLLLAACGPWTQAGGVYRTTSYTTELPAGWMRSNTVDYVLITRDGLFLQYIAIVQRDVDTAFKYTKKKLKRGMMPQEAAEVVLDDLASNTSITNFDIRENRPAKVSGAPAFKAVFTHKDTDGLRYKTVYYGVLKDDVFYGMRYTAPARHYFDADLRTFESVMANFRLQP